MIHDTRNAPQKQALPVVKSSQTADMHVHEASTAGPLPPTESDQTMTALTAEQLTDLVLRIREDDQNFTMYRPRFLPHLGNSVPAVLLFCQIEYWWGKMGRRPFYLFSEKCDHPLYTPGASWQEQLGFEQRVTKRALDKFAVKVKPGAKRSRILQTPMKATGKRDGGVFDGPPLVVYWTDANRLTWYEINEESRLLLLARVYAQDNEILRANLQYGGSLSKHQNGGSLSKHQNGGSLISETTPETTTRDGKGISRPTGRGTNFPARIATATPKSMADLERFGGDVENYRSAVLAVYNRLAQSFYNTAPAGEAVKIGPLTEPAERELAEVAQGLTDAGGAWQDVDTTILWCNAQEWDMRYGPRAILKYYNQAKTSKTRRDRRLEKRHTASFDCPECGEDVELNYSDNDEALGAFTERCPECGIELEWEV